MTNENLVMRTSRTLPFTPQAVYGAFASPMSLAAWWGPEGFTNTFQSFEFKVGGRWIFVMHGPDGSNYPNENVFLVLEPDAKVVLRHACPPYFTLTVRLSSVAGGTHLIWEQVFEDAETARAVRGIVVPANEQNLDRMTRVLSGAMTK
jgi:uncharacterized protein YndB with AHSA1/START domain